MIDFNQLLADYGISISTQEEGWIQIQCPYCISPTTGQKKHGGFNLKEEYYNCRKCGWKPLTTIFGTLLNTTTKQTKILLKNIKENQSRQTSKKRLPNILLLAQLLHRNDLQSQTIFRKKKFQFMETRKRMGIVRHKSSWRL